jgi:hypothetical protein
VLALAILAGAIAVVGELVRVGSLSAARARDLTQAQLICESKLAEITSGIAPPDPVSGATYELDVDWLYSVEAVTADIPGLMMLRVTAVQNLAPEQRPVEFSLTRLIQDPSVVLTPAQSTAGQTASSASGTGSAP